MKRRFKITRLATAVAAVALVTTLFCVSSVRAQVAGATTTTDVSISSSTLVARGWSVKKTLLGKAVYNDAGKKVGKIVDLIISPDRSVSYAIVGAGGFIGIGRHDVAIPVTQIQDQAGKLVMPGATMEMIKALPPFDYADDRTRRDQFVATAESDIAKGRARVTDLEHQAGTAATDAKARIDVRIAALQVDVKSAEGKLDELKKASAAHWKEFEAGVSAATARLRKSVDTAVG